MDPESFVRGGLTLTTFFFAVFFVDKGEEGLVYHYKRAIVGLPEKRHLAFLWWADDVPTLNAGLAAL